jgi:hypothetical protein
MAGPNDNENNDQGLDPGLFPGLEEVPQEYRQYIDPILSEINKNAGNKINEYSEKLSGWEPYEELGVNQLEPETVGQLMGILEMMGKAEEDPSELEGWYNELGEHFGFAEKGNAGTGEEEEEYDGSEGMSPDDLKNLIAQTVQEQITPFQQTQEQFAEKEGLEQAEGVLNTELSEVAKEFGVQELSPEAEEAICTFALKHEGQGQGAVIKGAEEYKQMIEAAEGNIFDAVAAQPEVPEGPGTPNTNAEPIRTFKDAKAAVEAALVQSANS